MGITRDRRSRFRNYHKEQLQTAPPHVSRETTIQRKLPVSRETLTLSFAAIHTRPSDAPPDKGICDKPSNGKDKPGGT